MNNLGEYPELIRTAISARLYALTGLVWTVEVRADNTNWDFVTGFDFVAKTGDFRRVSRGFGIDDLDRDMWDDLVIHLCEVFTHDWLYSLKMIPGQW